MLTKLKIGTIARKNYLALLTSFPKLQSLQLTKDEPFVGGYSFVYDIVDFSAPSSFRKASTM